MVLPRDVFFSELALVHLQKEACCMSNPCLLSLPQPSPLNLLLGKSSCSMAMFYCSGLLLVFKYATAVVNNQLTDHFT